MSRWVRGVIWVSGSCILTSPLLVCLHGNGSWWMCACTLGLLSVTMMSGYATWTLISQILYNENSCCGFQKRFLPSVSSENNEKEVLSSVIESALEEEIRFTAQAFHSHLVLPWYSYISPDDKYSYQIRSAFEDLLAGVCKNLRLHTKGPSLLQEISILYTQHYRQFYKALKKVSQKYQKKPIDCFCYYEEIAAIYKPSHPALKSDNGVDQHLRKLAQLLLINYLPPDVSGCALALVCLRDIFAQNILHAVVDGICDTQWLNETLLEFIERQTPRKEVEFLKNVDCSNIKYEALENTLQNSSNTTKSDPKGFSYMHTLSAISEENSLDVFDYNSFGIAGNLVSIRPVKKNEALALRNTFRNSQTPNFISLQTNNSQTNPENTECFPNSLEKSSNKPETIENKKHSVVSALGGLISTTTVPLISDNADITLKLPFIQNKMWESPMEERSTVSDIIQSTPQILGQDEVGIKEKSCLLKNSVLNNKATDSDEIKCESFENVSENQKDGNFDSLEVKTDLATIPRSKSLNSLQAKKVNNYTNGICSSAHLSASSEGISHDPYGEEKTNGNKDYTRKNKGLLQKMSSFDKFDGLEELNLIFSHTEKCKPELAIEAIDTTKFISGKPANMASQSGNSITSLKSVTITDDGQNEPPIALQIPPSTAGNSAKGFGWENPDLSPIYEESENLASTIAKLRCLLSERQSQHSLGSQSSFGSSESEPKSAKSDPGRSTHDRSRFSFLHKDNSASLASVKSSLSSSGDSSQLVSTSEEEPMEAAEIPGNGKIFVSISIPSTEVQSENAGFQYTVYVIQFDAIYLCDVLPNVAEELDSDCQLTEPKMILQTNTVKRRFREFLTLHTAVEDDPVLRGAMRGIKGPNKWLNLPFSKLDSATISSRKQFLEKYLQALIQRPLINTCNPLKEFLCYGSDSSIALGKKPLESGVPRLDKLLARTVSGVFNSLKTALPNFDSLESPQPGQVISGAPPMYAGSVFKPPGVLIQESMHLKKTSTLLRQEKECLIPFVYDQDYFDVQLDITADEEVCGIEDQLLSAIASTSRCETPIETASEAHDFPITPPSPLSLPLHPVFFHPLSYYTLGSSLSVSTGSGSRGTVLQPSFQACLGLLASYWRDIGFSTRLLRLESQDSLDASGTEVEYSSPLFLALVDAVIEILSSADHPLTRRGATLLFTQLCSKPASSYIQANLDVMMNEDLLRVIFNRIRAYCSPPPDSGHGTPIENTKERLCRDINGLIPGYIKVVLGTDTTMDSVALFVESLQHPIINQDFALHFIDLIFGHLLLPV